MWADCEASACMHGNNILGKLQNIMQQKAFLSLRWPYVVGGRHRTPASNNVLTLCTILSLCGTHSTRTHTNTHFDFHAAPLPPAIWLMPHTSGSFFFPESVVHDQAELKQSYAKVCIHRNLARRPLALIVSFLLPFPCKAHDD